MNDYMNLKNKYGLKKHEYLIILCLSILLTISLLITIVLIQYDTYDSHLKKRFSYLETGDTLCKYVDSSDTDVVMTPFAGFLLIVFTLFYKRRSCCLNRCKWKNIGLPIIIGVWTKKNRMLSALVFARIAFDVFRLFQNLFEKGEEVDVGKDSDVSHVHSACGLDLFFFRISFTRRCYRSNWIIFSAHETY